MLCYYGHQIYFSFPNLHVHVHSTYLMLSSGIPWNITHLNFLGIHMNLQASVYSKKIQVKSGIFHCVPQEHSISILYHAIDYKVAYAINATYVWSMMGRLYLSIYNSFPVFGLTLFSYGMAQKKLLSCNKRVGNCWKHPLITSV